MSKIPERLDVEVSLPRSSEQELKESVEKAGTHFIWAAIEDHEGRSSISDLETLLHKHISPDSNSQNPCEDLDSLHTDLQYYLRL